MSFPFIECETSECDLVKETNAVHAVLPPSDPQTMGELFLQLWKAENNSLAVGKQYRINIQGHAKQEEHYNAPSHLFSWVNEHDIFNRTTYKALFKLLSTYKKDVGACENYSSEKVHDIWSFLDAIYATPVMKKTHRYLAQKTYVSANEAAFKKILYTMWFELYPRHPPPHVNCPDSCAFEHVFIGEVKKPKVIGLHNWINFYRLEKQGEIDYRGRFQVKKESDCMGPSMISLKFGWGKDSEKPKSSIFLGTSPEFEMSLYTAAFFTTQAQGVESVTLARAPYEVNITCFHMYKRLVIGSCYLEFH